MCQNYYSDYEIENILIQLEELNEYVSRLITTIWVDHYVKLNRPRMRGIEKVESTTKLLVIRKVYLILKSSFKSN